MLLSNGTLILSVGKDTHETLGLTGEKRIADDNFVIRIDLASKSFVKGERVYERTIWAFESNYPHSFDFVVCMPAGKELKHRGFEIAECVQDMMTFEHILVPEPMDDLIETLETCTDKRDKNELALELLEWIGLATLKSPRLSPDSQVDPFVCLPVGLSERLVASPMTSLSVTGIISQETVETVISQVRSRVNDAEDEMKWAVLLVYGFRDAPVSWKGKAGKVVSHSRNQVGGGENDYALVLAGTRILLFKI
ncbi:MAG: hypothetical protein SGCHY_003868 [Lobulomycetales sp.]